MQAVIRRHGSDSPPSALNCFLLQSNPVKLFLRADQCSHASLLQLINYYPLILLLSALFICLLLLLPLILQSLLVLWCSLCSPPSAHPPAANLTKRSLHPDLQAVVRTVSASLYLLLHFHHLFFDPLQLFASLCFDPPTSRLHAALLAVVIPQECLLRSSSLFVFTLDPI